MKTLDEIYQIVEESSHETAFNRGEVEGMYNILNKLHDGAVVVEVGVQFGRSTSVIAEVSKEKSFNFTAIDNWCEENGAEAKAHVEAQIKKHGWTIALMSLSSAETAKHWQDDNLPKIDFLHIDGDHTYEGVATDCRLWLPEVVTYGYVAFDDYGHPGLVDVQKAADDYMRSSYETWEYIGTYGDKLGVFRKK